MEIHKNVIEEALRRARAVYGDGGAYKVTPYWRYNGGHAPASGCFGVVTDLRGYSVFLIALEDVWVDDKAMSWDDSDDDYFLLALEDVAFDSIMLDGDVEPSTIFYFPKVTVAE